MHTLIHLKSSFKTYINTLRDGNVMIQSPHSFVYYLLRNKSAETLWKHDRSVASGVLNEGACIRLFFRCSGM